MIELKGRYNEAKIFTDVVDATSVDQVMLLLDQEFVLKEFREGVCGGKQDTADAGYPCRGRMHHRNHHDNQGQGSSQPGRG